MEGFAERLRELRGSSSQAEMARELGMKQPQWARYESGASLPSIDILATICRAHACSADWLLGLPERGGSAGGGENAPGAKHQAPGTRHQAPATPPPDCSRCQLMLAHIREITGRK